MIGEMVTMGVSVIGGGLLKLWGMKMQADKANQLATTEALTMSRGMTQDARKWDNPHVQWTRRLIALSAVGAIVVLPKVAAVINPELAITVGWTEWKSGFLFFTEGKDVMQWQTVTGGLVITPLDTHLMSAIAGLYFGGSLAGHK